MDSSRRTVKSFNATLKVLAQTKHFDYVVEFLEQASLKFDIRLDVYSINIVVKAFCDMGRLQEAYLFMLESENDKGIRPDVVEVGDWEWVVEPYGVEGLYAESGYV